MSAAKRRRGLASRLWHQINEPRAITIIVALGYLVLTWGGYSALQNPPRTIESAMGDYAMAILAAMFLVGGVLGFLTSLPGWNWLERGAVLLSGAAAIIYGILVLILNHTSTGNRELQLSLITFAVLMLSGRGIWIWSRPFAKRRDQHAADD